MSRSSSDAEQLLMAIAEAAELGHAAAEDFELRLALGDFDLAVALETAIVVDQIADAVPELHRGKRERNLGHMTAEPAHPARIHARGVAADVILLEERYPSPRRARWSALEQP